ncbi:CaiB/BaiF CoA transferase family protein [Noviherbaspirillum aerium]|uniref:CaiB/BaiF CoA transferase family protein n=1 Tax=Noviherbaspirillum aerium TaxID=2588497 RepID=UPI00124D6797|nr:CoA transferase [Noviherbaspirillum aerium]
MDTSFSPLRDIRVVDFSHVIAGPFSTFYLAQMGAEVLKIENPNGGDVMRRSEGGAKAFLNINAGKRCVSIDVSTPAGRDEAMKHAAAADVFVDNLRPGVLEKHGLGFADVKAVNPRIVYCSISGYGRTGEWQERPAYDHIVQAITGMMMLGGEEGSPPIKTGFPVVDAAAGIIAALAIVSALRERDRTGEGMLLDVSMTSAALQLMYPFACTALTEGTSPKRVGNQGYSGSPAADTFKTRDGWIALGANTPKQVISLLNVLGHGELASDPDVFNPPLDASQPGTFARAANSILFKERLQQYVLEQNAAALEEALNAANVPAAKVRTLGEFVSEGKANGGLSTRCLREGDVSVVSPGLGFQVLQR